MELHAEDVSVELRRVLLGIAQALDAVGFDELHHSHRVGYMAYRCARLMGWDEEQAQLAFSTGLVHDCGSTQSSASMPLVFPLQSGSFARHCEKGYKLLLECAPLSCFATPVLYHHTPWSELQHLPIAEADKELATLINLVNRVDHLYRHQPKDKFGNLSAEAKLSIAHQLQQHSGTVFEANMVQHMTELVDNDDFWFSMHPRYIEAKMMHLDSVPFFSSNIGLDETIAIAELFAKVVDAKSTFTFQHSLKVAQLSKYLAKQLAYSPKMQKMLYLAGLVHDIGKLCTPDVVLHKPGKLTAEEYTCIKRHATDTRFILQGIITSPLINEWASNHHERLDGSGYPLGKIAQELDRPSRIVALSDVFQALTQSRPYREGITLQQALQIVGEMVDANQLDREIFDCLTQHADYCYQLSVDDDIVMQSQVM
ncbi:HD domain-containing protein [Vibrio fluvialis]|uniref:HD-GYP domain-containing protein n=1 Tax=Vibrio fluvialis TaxID=676 RepID=UPI00192BFC23|nr:HD domain-containing phosphohydrolase [Vibrio fluvialis]MBL4296962.1 HD domain-containing protein [Vibrio fluvialis]